MKDSLIKILNEKTHGFGSIKVNCLNIEVKLDLS